MDIKGIQQNPSLQPDAGFQGAPTGGEVKDTAPILGGENVKVDSKTDFEKLLAEMEMKREEQREKMFASRFAAAMTVLAGRHDIFTVQQQEAFSKVASATDAFAKATDDLEQATNDLATSQAVLEVLNQHLEAVLQANIKTPEDRLEELEAAEKLKDESEAEEVKEETEVKEEESAEVQELRQKIADQEKKVADAETRVKKATENKGKAAANLSEALAALDSVGLQYVVNTVISSIKEIVAAAAEQPDGVEKKEKANPIIQALSEYVDKIQEMQDEELEELIAKVTPAIVLLAESDLTVDPTVFPEYEKHV